MKKLASFITLCLFVLLLCPSESNAQSAFMGVDLDKAQQMSKSSGKAVMLVISADHCPPCKKMEATTFRDPSLLKVMKRQTHPIKLKNNDLDVLSFVIQHGIRVYPQILFISPEGKTIQRLEGFFDAEGLKEVISSL